MKVFILIENPLLLARIPSEAVVGLMYSTPSEKTPILNGLVMVHMVAGPAITAGLNAWAHFSSVPQYLSLVAVVATDPLEGESHCPSAT